MLATDLKAWIFDTHARLTKRGGGKNSLGKNRILPTLQKFCQVKKPVISNRLAKFTWQTKENLHQEPWDRNKIVFPPFLPPCASGCALRRRVHICALWPFKCQVSPICQAKCQMVGEGNSQILAKKWNAKSKCQTVGVALYWGTTLNHYNTNLIRRFSDIPRWHFLWYWVTNV